MEGIVPGDFAGDPCWDPGSMIEIDSYRDASPIETIFTDEGCDPWNEGLWQWILSPTMFLTGDLLPGILVGLLIIMVYMRTGSAIFAGVIGALYLPVAAYVFPDQLVSGGVAILMIVLAASVWFGLVRQADRR